MNAELTKEEEQKVARNRQVLVGRLSQHRSVVSSLQDPINTAPLTTTSRHTPRTPITTMAAKPQLQAAESAPGPGHEIVTKWTKLLDEMMVVANEVDAQLQGSGLKNKFARMEECMGALLRAFNNTTNIRESAHQHHRQVVRALLEGAHIHLQRCCNSHKVLCSVIVHAAGKEKAEWSQLESESHSRLQNFVDSIRHNHHQRLTEAQQRFEGHMTQLEQSMEENKTKVEDKLRKQLTQVKTVFLQHQHAYNEKAEQFNAELEKLDTRANHMQQKINGQAARIMELQETTRAWRSRLASATTEHEQKNLALKQEREAITHHFLELKHQQADMHAGHLASLTRLSVRADKEKRLLEDKISVARKLLGLVEQIGRLETENGIEWRPEDAIVDVPVSFESTTSGNHELKDQTRSLGSAQKNSLRHFPELDLFFQRFNRGALAVKSLEKEVQELRMRQQQLKINLAEAVERSTVPANTVLEAKKIEN